MCFLNFLYGWPCSTSKSKRVASWSQWFPPLPAHLKDSGVLRTEWGPPRHVFGSLGSVKKKKLISIHGDSTGILCRSPSPKQPVGHVDPDLLGKMQKPSKSQHFGWGQVGEGKVEETGQQSEPTVLSI